jgi:hypothetical protein
MQFRDRDTVGNARLSAHKFDELIQAIRGVRFAMRDLVETIALEHFGQPWRAIRHKYSAIQYSAIQPRDPRGVRTGGQWIAYVSDTPPAYRSGVEAVNKYWKQFNDAVAKRKGMSATRQLAYSEIFAGEGGYATDKPGAASGISQDTLDRAKNAGVPGLAGVSEPVDLSIEQRVAVYEHYFDDVMRTVGGAKALDQISNPRTATAVADTLFNHGSGSGPSILRQAVNDVLNRYPGLRDKLGIANVSQSGGMNKELFDAIKQLTDNGRAEQLRERIAEVRLVRIDRRKDGQVKKLTEDLQKLAGRQPRSEDERANIEAEKRRLERKIRNLRAEQQALHERVDHFRFRRREEKI